jgi:hypothetical protein
MFESFKFAVFNRQGMGEEAEAWQASLHFV